MHRIIVVLGLIAASAAFMYYMIIRTRPNANVDDLLKVLKCTTVFLTITSLVAIATIIALDQKR
jgi:hypothetical protein